MKLNYLIALCSSLTLSLVASSALAVPNVELRSFSLSSSSLAASGNRPTTLTANWSASTTSSSTKYFVSAHIFPTSSNSRTPTDANRFLQRSCHLSVFTCSDPQIEQCTFNSAHRLSCSVGTGVLLSPGTYNIIARACIYDVTDNAKEICSLKESSLVIQ